MTTQTLTDLQCYHCHQPCEEEVWQDDKVFCCSGCRTVYEILSKNNLCDYYALDANAGIPLQSPVETVYDYLDKPEIRKKVIVFDSDNFSRASFFIPAIHCISCIWLLENLHKIEKGVTKAEVNFSSRKVTIDFNPGMLALSDLAHRLATLGYTPQITADAKKPANLSSGKSLIVKLSIAGFAFANIMLLSFPEYLGLDDSEKNLRELFTYLNIALAVPVMVFSAQDYLINGWKSLTQKQINIDLPIALGLLALFSRSVYDILTHSGPGYLDSLSGLVFFLLIGRWFQGRTYDTLAFDRDYKSYFPLAVQKWSGHDWLPEVIYELEPGDRIRIRNMEVVPADSQLLSDRAFIDYSFVTGESRPVKMVADSLVYAGGRLIGQPIELVVTKKTSQGHLTSLWNNSVFQKIEQQGYKKLIDLAAKRFTWMVMALAILTAVAWYAYDPSRVWLVLTSVLMVACPCALALAAPFTYGSMLRVLGKNHLYLKNADVIERMASVDAVVFDKTGTVTYTKKPKIDFIGKLSTEEMGWIKILTGYSTHPLSNLITRNIPRSPGGVVEDFKEFPGEGIEGRINGHLVKIGSANFTGHEQLTASQTTAVFISVDDEARGYFSIVTTVRKNFKEMIVRLGRRCAALVSGDNEGDRLQMSELFGQPAQLVFNQSPMDKLLFIKALQRMGKKVMMVGDGLNDAGALKQSDVGIAVTDDTSVFTPACDGILDGDRLATLDRLLDLARSSSLILKFGFAISFLYNAIALTFAITGHLTPLTAAILMPISSISVVGFATLAVNYMAKSKLSVEPQSHIQ